MRIFRSRFCRLAAVGVVVVAAASCTGYTTAATNIAVQADGSFSAQLNFVGSCGAGEHCSWYVRYRRVGTSTWAHVPAAAHAPIAGPVSKVSLFEKVTDLTAGAQYEYQACGNAQPGQRFVCVGPDGTPNTTTKFTISVPAWRLEPSASLFEPDGFLTATSCSSASACTAVGGYTDGNGTSVTLAERSSGTAWTIETTPKTNPSAAMSSTLSGVSCVSTTACTAVGTITGPFFGETLTERWNGMTWTAQTTPTSTNDGKAGSLSGVSCTSATACTAVGRYFINGTWATLAERWNGTSWTIQNTPNPSGAMSSNLMGVSCTSTTACTAVGGYDDRFGTPSTLAERWNGTSWSIETTPNPSGTSGLTGVSCTSPTACTAVGIDEVAPATATFVTLGERWNGNTWTIQTTPQPSSAISSNLSGVSCTSATTCTAVGDYVNSIGTQETLAERWNGTSWTIQTTPNTSGEQASTLSAVSCTSTTTCTAVGEYVNSNGTPEALAEHYSS